MDPTNPLPQTPPAAPAGMPPRRFSPKIVIAGGVLLVVVIGLIIFLAGGKDEKDANNKDGTDASLQIHREGYADDEAGGAIADAEALSATTTDKVITFNGKAVIQPCALITPKDLRDNGSLLLANPQATPVEQNAFSGQGDQTPAGLSNYIITTFGRSNTCQYALKKPADAKALLHTIEINVMQVGINVTEAALADELTKYTPQPDLSGIKVYKQNPRTTPQPESATYILRSANASAEVRLVLPDQAKMDTYLKLLATRLKAAETKPTGAVTFTLKSPIFKGKIYQECSLLDDSNFTTIVRAPASPLTKQTYASAIGIIQSYKDPSKLFNYVSYECSRDIADGKGSGQMRLNAVSYETEEGAKDYVEFMRTQEPNAVTVTPTIGDESWYGNAAGMHNALVVRKGRLLLQVTYSSTLDGASRVNALRPAMEAVVKNAADY